MIMSNKGEVTIDGERVEVCVDLLYLFKGFVRAKALSQDSIRALADVFMEEDDKVIEVMTERLVNDNWEREKGVIQK